MEVAKHKKIAMGLHILNALFYLVIGFIFFGLSGAFGACTGGERGDISNCFSVASIFIGLPLVIGLFPVIALTKENKFTRGFLWFYSIFIIIMFIPIGTGIGAHTIHYLKVSKNHA